MSYTNSRRRIKKKKKSTKTMKKQLPNQSFQSRIGFLQIYNEEFLTRFSIDTTIKYI